MSGGGCKHVYILISARRLSDGRLMEHWQCDKCGRKYTEVTPPR